MGPLDADESSPRETAILPMFTRLSQLLLGPTLSTYGSALGDHRQRGWKHCELVHYAGICIPKARHTRTKDNVNLEKLHCFVMCICTYVRFAFSLGTWWRNVTCHMHVCMHASWKCWNSCTVNWNYMTQIDTMTKAFIVLCFYNN